MSFLYNDHSPTANNSVQPFGVSYTNQAEGTHAENFKAAFNMFTTSETTWSPAIVMEEIWQPIVDIMNEREPGLEFQKDPWLAQKAAELFKLPKIMNPAGNLRMGVLVSTVDERLRNGNSSYVQLASKYLDHIQKNPEIYPEFQELTLEKLLEQGKEYANQKRTDFDEMAARSPGNLKAITRFAGMAGGIIEEPVVMGSMMFGAGASSLFKIAINQLVNIEYMGN